MITYFMIGVKSFTQNLAYRSEVWLRTVGNFVTISIQVAIWKALLGNGAVNGITFSDMITYSILNTLIFSILLTNVFRKVDTSLRSGNIAVELIKPLKYPLFLFADQMGAAMYQFFFTAIPTVIVSWLFFGISAPSSSAHFVAFLAALILSLLISFGIGYLIALISFWFLTAFALEWTLMGVMTVFSGSFLPLWFFPPLWRAAAEAMPFPFVGYIPAAIYMGRIPEDQLLSTLGLGFMWIVILFGLVYFLWWRAVARLVVQGG